MTRLLVLVLAAVLAFAAPAFGASSAQGGYGGVAGESDNVSQGTGPGSGTGSGTSGSGVAGQTASAPRTSTSGGSGDLPFTGFDALLIAAGGAALLGSGMTVRRLARAPRV